MLIQIGYELDFECTQPTPTILMLNVHYTRVADLLAPDHLLTSPALPIHGYRDLFGNWCTRLTLPVGQTKVRGNAVIRDTALPDTQAPMALQTPVDALPDDCLVFLLGSRYCETDRLSEIAWGLFGSVPAGWARVAAICSFVHQHVKFGYQHARVTKTAWETYQERTGVCRDYAHLAIALCRCMNIPARYCTGYLGDIQVPISPEPMDFSGWFEAYLDRWYTFDARHNVPRVGRVLIARGRDAADVAISTGFGVSTLRGFKVQTDEVAHG